jgi:hypothetical protein
MVIEKIHGMSDDLQLTDSLRAVAEAAEVGEIEIAAARAVLKVSEKQIGSRIAALVANVSRIVTASNSQTLRGTAIRKLYWETSIKASVIAGAFGTSEHAIYSTAGPLIEETPCERACGRKVQRIYRTRSDLRENQRTSKRGSSYLCTECERRRVQQRGSL